MIRYLVLFKLKPGVAREDEHPAHQTMVAVANQSAGRVICDYEY